MGEPQVEQHVAKVKAQANPRLLTWAREQSGLSIDDAAKKLGITAARLAEWEAGREAPTIPQLRGIAQIYKRPLAAFYLSEPPTSFRVGADFRRSPGEVAGTLSPELRLELRAATYHRDVADELYRELGEEPPRFEFTTSLDNNAEEVGESLRRHLAINDAIRDVPRVVFNRWRQAIEDRGVLVFQMTRVTVSEMRGFSIAEDPLPVIAVNRKDAYAGRLFSLVHELAHIALSIGGICDINESGVRPTDAEVVEQFCNHVAGATLVPRQALLSHPIVRGNASPVWTGEALLELGRAFGVSREVILRRLLILDRTTIANYRAARARFLKEYAEIEAREPQTQEMKRNMPVETVGALGRSFVGLVLSTYGQDRITLSDVATYLGIRLKHLDNIARLVGPR